MEGELAWLDGSFAAVHACIRTHTHTHTHTPVSTAATETAVSMCHAFWHDFSVENEASEEAAGLGLALRALCSYGPPGGWSSASGGYRARRPHGHPAEAYGRAMGPRKGEWPFGAQPTRISPLKSLRHVPPCPPRASKQNTSTRAAVDTARAQHART